MMYGNFALKINVALWKRRVADPEPLFWSDPYPVNFNPDEKVDIV